MHQLKRLYRFFTHAQFSLIHNSKIYNLKIQKPLLSYKCSALTFAQAREYKAASCISGFPNI